MSVLKSRGPNGPRPPVSGAAAPDEWAERYPGIVEMLTADHDPSGKPRQGATLLLFYGDSLAKLCLNDRDQGLSAWITALTLSEALDALEKGLQADTLEWRKPRPTGKQRGR